MVRFALMQVPKLSASATIIESDKWLLPMTRDYERGQRGFHVLGTASRSRTWRTPLATLEKWMAAGAKHYMCVTGVHGVMEAYKDTELREIHNMQAADRSRRHAPGVGWENLW